MYILRTKMLKIFSLDKINDAKNVLFSLLRVPTHHSFTFNLWFSIWAEAQVSSL